MKLSEEALIYLKETYYYKYFSKGTRYWTVTKWTALLSLKNLIPYSKELKYAYWYKQVGKEIDRINKEYKKHRI